jgi:hypothetical protein
MTFNSPQRGNVKPPDITTPRRGIPVRDMGSPPPSQQIIPQSILFEACHAVNTEITTVQACFFGGAALGILGHTRGTRAIDLLALNGTKASVKEEMAESERFWVEPNRQVYLASNGKAYAINIIEPADISLSPRHGYAFRETVKGVTILKPALLLNLKVHSWKRRNRDSRDLSDIFFLLQYMRRRKLQTDAQQADLITQEIVSEIISNKPDTASLWRVIGFPNSKASSPSHSTHSNASSYESAASFPSAYSSPFSGGSTRSPHSSLASPSRRYPTSPPSKGASPAVSSRSRQGTPSKGSPVKRPSWR